MTDDELVIVCGAEDEIEAMYLRAVLDGAGIQFVEQRFTSEFGRLRRNIDQLYSQFLVKAEDAPRASLVIREYQQQLEAGALALDDEDE